MFTRPHSTCGCIAHQLAGVLALAFLLSITANAQQFSPRHHIAFTCSGFYEKSDKWIAKRTKKSEKHHGPAIAAQFEHNMLQLRAFGEWLDKAWDDGFTEFAACHDMRSINPSQIRVQIESAPFPVAGYPPTFLAAGVAPLSGRIQVVYWNVRSDIGGQEAVALAFGEIRNWLWWKLHGQSRELWGIPACGH